MKISLLKKGNPGFNLFLIPGLNSGNDLSAWNVKELNFPGNILGLKWDNYLKDWDLFKSGMPDEIFNKISLFNFIREYNEVCLNADAAGRFLAQNVHAYDNKQNFILAHSMGTRAAFNYLKYCIDRNKNNQIILFNGAVSRSEKLHNFRMYHGKALTGIFNYYNFEDKVLNVLPLIKDIARDMFKIPVNYLASFDVVKEKTESLKKKLQDSKLINKSFQLIRELNSVYNFDEAANFFEPIGICNSKTIPENISINEIQKDGHSIDYILEKIIIFDDLNNKFISKLNPDISLI